MKDKGKIQYTNSPTRHINNYFPLQPPPIAIMTDTEAPVKTPATQAAPIVKAKIGKVF